MTMQKSRVDDVLVGQAIGDKEMQKSKPKVDVPVAPEPEKIKVEHLEKAEAPPVAKKQQPPSAPAKAPTPTPQELPEAAKLDDNVTDYGLPVEKKERMYSEAEVQQMMRDRVARMKQPAVETPPVPVTPKISAADVEPWQAELKEVIRSVTKEEQEAAAQREWRQQEQQTQVEFENKMNVGMSKYQDYWPTVNSAPITTTMMIATRGMDAPADFLYAAAKLQPAELARIAKIKDPATQMVQMGMLEANMRKSSRVTQAARPLERIASDYTETPKPAAKEKTTDDKIREYEQTKFRRVGR